MKIVHTLPSLAREQGGPPHSVTHLCSTLATKAELNVNIYSEREQNDDSNLIKPSGDVNLFLLAHRRQGHWLARQKMLKQLLQPSGVTLIHDHGLWLPFHHCVAMLGKSKQIPLVVSPRGMLEPWALRRYLYKKRVAWILYQRRNLSRATVIHATSRAEATHVRQLGLSQPIAIVPNGINLPALQNECKSNRQFRRRRILFLSRLHPVKGLLHLVDALKIALPATWEVVIAGPDEANHRREVESAVRNAHLDNQIRFVGAVNDTQKWELYRTADLFVLPSFSENFGIVIAEALAAGVPVITTRKTPWRELETHGCGWWIEGGVKPLVDALQHAIAAPDAEREAMGKNGRSLISQKYSWSEIADQMLGVYQWVIHGGSKPPCMFTT